MSPPPESPNLTSMSKEKKKKKQQQREGDASSKKRSREHEGNEMTKPKGNERKKKEKRESQKQHDANEKNRRVNGGADVAAEDGSRKRITDPRFASVHTDPRFQRMPRRQNKVVIDSRFSGAFKDKRFALSTAPVDKRGKARKGKRKDPLRRYYVQEEEPRMDGDGGDREEMVRDGIGAISEVMVPNEEKDGESGTDSSSTSSSTEGEEDDDGDDDDQYSVSSDIAHYLMGNHGDTPQTEETTRRLAVVNIDWDHIKAVDIYVVMRSCLPKNGHISSVAIYPSEFGLKCMEIEATQGPSALINGNHEKDVGDFEDSDDDVDNEKENEKLRSYELNRLRYYYAVVDCDSNITANHLYETLDGTELLKTSNVFDLRFIPDSMEFAHPPRDTATEAPSNYREPDFQTQALQHSNVKLSWEDDEPKRKKVLRRKFNTDQLDDLEFKEFLASDNEDSDEYEDDECLPDGEIKKLKKGEKYLALLQSADGSDPEDEGDQDMEITFNTGLEDIAKRVLEKKDRKSETVWEAYLRRRKEKKKARKKNAKYSTDDDTESDSEYLKTSDGVDEQDDFFVEDQSDADLELIKGKKDKSDRLKVKRERRKRDEQLKLEKDQEASQAELELLCANADGTESPSEDEHVKSKKNKKKRKKQPSEKKLPKEDYHDDPRFSGLFTSHLYALDPTDPQFKRSATYARQMIKKHKDSGVNAKPSGQIPPPEKGTYETADIMQSKDNSPCKEKAEFLSVVRSLKRKTEAMRSDGKGQKS